jgi:hypothetical protein
MEWDWTWLASITGKARDVGRPPGPSGEWLRRCPKGCDDVIDLLSLATPEERERQE